MSKTDQKPPFVTAYAASLLELATEQKQAEAIGQDLEQLRAIVADNRTFRLYLSDPAISHTERSETLKKVFAGKISPLLNNFLGVLNEKGRLGSLTQVAEEYADLLAEQMGKVDVEVTVPSELSAQQLDDVRKQVSAALKKEAVVHQTVDSSIIGGLMLRVQDKLIDASVKTQLKAMKEQLLSSQMK